MSVEMRPPTDVAANPPEGNNRMATTKIAKTTVVCQKYLRFSIYIRIIGITTIYVICEMFLPKAKL